MSLKIACLQLDIAFGDPHANYAYVEAKLNEAIRAKPDIIVLPELWDTGYDLTRLDDIADPDGVRVKRLCSHYAKTNAVYIVAGSIAQKTEQGFTNTMYVFDQDGQSIAQYSKLHLFKLMDEHLYLQPGEQTNLFSIGQTLCAGVICYDIRFPEWIRVHTNAGAEVLFVVAQWPAPRLAHWKALLTSRAIENQCYVVACNRVGSDPNNIFGGHSLIIDPWGNIIAEAGEHEEMLTGSIELALVKEIRSQIPIFADRRPELYQ